MSDPRQIQYLAALAAAATLVVRLDPAPTDLIVRCSPWTPTETHIRLNAHVDLAAVKAWAVEVGAEMTRKVHHNDNVHWSFTTTVAGVAVEAYTLLSPAEDEQQAGGAE